MISLEYDSTYLYGLGMECFEKNELQKALGFFQKSIEIEPHFKTYERMFVCFNKLGSRIEAKECIKRAFQLNDKNDKVTVEYVSILIEENSIDEAVLVLNDLLKRNPTYGPAKKLLDKINPQI